MLASNNRNEVLVKDGSFPGFLVTDKVKDFTRIQHYKRSFLLLFSDKVLHIIPIKGQIVYED